MYVYLILSALLTILFVLGLKTKGLFKCVECNATFRDTKGLSNHMRVHTRDDDKALPSAHKKSKGMMHAVIIIRYVYVSLTWYDNFQTTWM
jgi:hypothetical protein